jgi:CTP synthase
MRLGSYPCKVLSGTLLEKCYAQPLIHERHRHRYEFNNDYREKLSACGMVLSGTSPDGRIIETIELKDHPFYIGVQFHPEFKSRPNRAHPLFKGFVAASLKNSKK